MPWDPHPANERFIFFIIPTLDMSLDSSLLLHACSFHGRFSQIACIYSPSRRSLSSLWPTPPVFSTIPGFFLCENARENMRFATVFLDFLLKKSGILGKSEGEAVVFCGDFNFTPGSAPYQLFTTSTLPQRHQSYPRPPGETTHHNPHHKSSP